MSEWERERERVCECVSEYCTYASNSESVPTYLTWVHVGINLLLQSPKFRYRRDSYFFPAFSFPSTSGTCKVCIYPSSCLSFPLFCWLTSGTVALYTCSLHTSLCTLPSHHLGKVWYGMVGVSISAAFYFWLGKARMIEKSILGPWP